MITEYLKGEELFNEIWKDWKVIRKEIKRIRSLHRKNHKEKVLNKCLLEFTKSTPQFNKWNVQTYIWGDHDKPGSFDRCWIDTNAGKGGKKLYIMYRGLHTTDKGYLVSLTSHALLRIRERGGYEGESVSSIMAALFNEKEEGVYYDFDWHREIPRDPYEVAEARTKEEAGIKIVLKTALGIFLGYSSTDRAEVRLITYLKEWDGELGEMIDNFLIPAWILYNDPSQSEVRKKLFEYMDGKEDRNVYRLSY